MTHATTPIDLNPFSLAGPDLMRGTLAELCAWEIQAARQIIVRNADDEAWKGTEIDTRRTVL